MRAAAVLVLAVAASILPSLPLPAHAQTPPFVRGLPASCEFEHDGRAMRLVRDCVTTETIELPDGATLDGSGHTIFAVDPPGDSFRGAVIAARGLAAAVIDTGISAVGLAGVCQAGADRLRGIYFDGASGIIRGNIVHGIHKGPSACWEGHAIEVRNRNFERSTTAVVIEENVVGLYQKSGIIVHGNVDARVRANLVGISATQRWLPANGIQAGPGALVRIEHNLVYGNTFAGDVAATAILLTLTDPGTLVANNAIRGNADVGIYVRAEGASIIGNDLVDTGPDEPSDIGIVNFGSGNQLDANTVTGYRVPSMSVPAAPGGVFQLE